MGEDPAGFHFVFVVFWVCSGLEKETANPGMCSSCKQQHVIRSACINQRHRELADPRAEVSGERGNIADWVCEGIIVFRDPPQGQSGLENLEKQMRKHPRGAHDTPQELRLRANMTGLEY